MYSSYTFSQWLEPDFPINYIYDISNYTILTLFLYFFIKFKTDLKNHSLYLYNFLMLSPFLFNGILIEWFIFPDQSKYVGSSRIYRDLGLDINNSYNYLINGGNWKVVLTGLFYNLFPSTNFETYRSIGFINRFLFLLMVIFLINKKTLPLSVKILLLFSPSLAMYSSISLREILILVIMVFLIYNLFNKKYLFSAILTIFLYNIKFQNLVIVYLIILISFLFEGKKNKFNLSVLFLIIFLGLNFLNIEQFINYINKVSLGFFSETYGGYRAEFVKDFYHEFNIYNLIPKLFYGFIKVTLSPFPNLNSTLNTVVFFENLLIYFVIYLNFFDRFSEKPNFNKKIILYWFFILVFSFMMYSIVSYNDGTVHRYKIIILTYILIGYNLHLTKKKNFSK